MKFLQCALCGLFLTLTAGAQTAPSSPSQAPSTAPQSPAGAARLSSLGGDDAKPLPNALTLAQMKELYVAMGYDKVLEENRTGMLAQQKQRAPFIPQDVWDDFDATSKKVDYPAALLKVYQKYLTTDDATKLIEFSKTDAGKHFVGNLPLTSREVALTVQQQQQQVGVEVQGRHKDEIEAAVKKYREQNQPKPAPSLGPPSTPPAAAPSAPSTPSTPPAAPKN